jgi:hypothetical protein
MSKELKLKKKQVAKIAAVFEQADTAYLEGKPGAVLGQIWRDATTGKVFVDVQFVENERSAKIYEALNGRKPPKFYYRVG